MIWLIELGLVLLLVGVAWNTFGRRRRSDDREQITERRVEAYMTTLRREGRNPHLAAMTDTELRDVLHAASRNLRIEGERKNAVLLGVCAVALVAAIAVGSQDGTRGFLIALAVGVMVIYGLNEYLTRRMQEPLLRQGIEIERLKVE